MVHLEVQYPYGKYFCHVRNEILIGSFLLLIFNVMGYDINNIYMIESKLLNLFWIHPLLHVNM